MNEELRLRIDALDVAEPWVWRLKLSESDFSELESAVTAVTHNELLKPEWAKAVIVYMAEWYKRRYKGGKNSDALNLSSAELETVWRNAGLSTKRLVYRDSGGNRRWQYSTYVLGGLAIRHELGRNDKGRFLKAICRLYHRENYTIENLDSEERAVSFRESIQREHSLFHYLREIMNGNFPFSDDDLKDSSSEVNRFIYAIKSANDEVMRRKFQLEWIVTNIPENTVFTRKLRLLLKPEEVGEGLRQYLRFDRVTLWGIAEPEKVQNLKVGIRFFAQGKLLAPIDWAHPLITYQNTGDATTGFIAVNVSDHADCQSLPYQKFDRLEIVVRNEDDGKEYIAQEEDCHDYLQLWRISENDYQWSSIQNAQHQTALIFSEPWHLELKSTSDEIETRPFKDKKTGLTAPWHWRHIYDEETISDGKTSINFYNRQGYYRVATRLYSNAIKYINGGMVEYFTYDEEYDQMESRLLPLIFGTEDIIIRHFNTKDDILDAQPDKDFEADLIEYKDGSRYTPWTDSESPNYGVVKLRITLKGRQENYDFVYLPRLEGEAPIIRDFENARIRYMNFGKDKAVTEEKYQDTIPADYRILHPTVSLKIGRRKDYANIEVWRPTLRKEVVLDNVLVQYLQDREEFNLPYLIKRRVNINDFSRQGFRHYECGNLGSIYTDKFLNIKGNPTVGMAALAAWENGNRYAAKLLDGYAPEFLYVIFGDTLSLDLKTQTDSCLFWDYNRDVNPREVSPSEVQDEWGLVFQDRKKSKSLRYLPPKMQDEDLWGWDEESTSYLKCFEVANEHNLYFFEMMPLRELSSEAYVDMIYTPLMTARDGELTDTDKAGLLRFAEEFGFNWQDRGVVIDTEVIS